MSWSCKQVLGFCTCALSLSLFLFVQLSACLPSCLRVCLNDCVIICRYQIVHLPVIFSYFPHCLTVFLSVCESVVGQSVCHADYSPSLSAFLSLTSNYYFFLIVLNLHPRTLYGIHIFTAQFFFTPNHDQFMFSSEEVVIN